MTKRTSSRSVKATPKTVEEPGSNGTPPTDPSSENISLPAMEEETGWTIQFSNGGVHHVRVKGGRGRISFSGGSPHGRPGEVRVYRNESTKVFDAAFSGVTHIISDRVKTFLVHHGRNSHEVTEPAFGGPPPTVASASSLTAKVSKGSEAMKKILEELEEKQERLNPEDF